MEERVIKTKEKLTEAFKLLRKQGYFAKQNFKCCQGCACAAIPAEKRDKYVFFHKQDNEGLQSKGKVYLAWNGEGSEIVKTLNSVGLFTNWSGENFQRIQVTF